MKIITKCVHCGKEIVKYSRQKEIHNWFCSVECKGNFSRKQTTQSFQCDYCGKFFSKRTSEVRGKNKFCSVKCSHDSLTDNNFYVEDTCDYCGKNFRQYKKSYQKSKQHFCTSECYWNFIKVDKRFGNVYRRIALTNIKEPKCEICGWSNGIDDCLDIHHIDENRKNNTKENLIILCPNCHSVVTRGWGEIKNRKLLKFEVKEIKNRKYVLNKDETDTKIKNRIEQLKNVNLDEYGIYAKMSKIWNVSTQQARSFMISIKNYLKENKSWEEIILLKLKYTRHTK